MFNHIKRITAIIVLSGWGWSANAALIFDFSFGTPGNEIVGEIIGLQDIDDIAQGAEIIRITTLFGSQVNIEYNMGSPFIFIIDNEFKLNNGSISSVVVDVNFLVIESGNVVRNDSFGLGRTFASHVEYISDVDYVGFSPAPFSLRANAPSPVPEPGSILLVVLGLAGLSCSRYKKKY